MKFPEILKNLRITKKFLLEFAVFVFLILVAFLFREKPVKIETSEYEFSSFPASNYTYNHTAYTKNETLNETLSKVQRIFETTSYVYLKKRNPFSLEGSYLEKEIPENPFTLVAVKIAKEKSAILKFFTGELIKVKEGSTLPDGSKVVKINPNSVILKRLGKKRELKIFQVEVEKWKPKKPFGS